MESKRPALSLCSAGRLASYGACNVPHNRGEGKSKNNWRESFSERLEIKKRVLQQIAHNNGKLMFRYIRHIKQKMII